MSKLKLFLHSVTAIAAVVSASSLAIGTYRTHFPNESGVQKEPLARNSPVPPELQDPPSDAPAPKHGDSFSGQDVNVAPQQYPRRAATLGSFESVESEPLEPILDSFESVESEPLEPILLPPVPEAQPVLGPDISEVSTVVPPQELDVSPPLSDTDVPVILPPVNSDTGCTRGFTGICI